MKALVPNLTLMDVSRSAPDLCNLVINLVSQAKKFVESLPKVLKENVSKEDAEKLAKVFEGIGGVVKLE